MRKFAIIDVDTGVAQGLVCPATDDMIEDEEICPDIPNSIYKEVPEDMWQDFSVATYWWGGTMWRIRPTPPSEHHKTWDNVSNSWSLDSDSLWRKTRELRANNLRNSDWTQLPDAPLTEAEKQQWRDYRQALRDVPANNPNIQFLADIQWPEKPTTPRN